MQSLQVSVVICSHFSIFGTLETTPTFVCVVKPVVVICSHFSIFGTLETTASSFVPYKEEL